MSYLAKQPAAQLERAEVLRLATLVIEAADSWQRARNVAARATAAERECESKLIELETQFAAAESRLLELKGVVQ